MTAAGYQASLGALRERGATTFDLGAGAWAALLSLPSALPEGFDGVEPARLIAEDLLPYLKPLALRIGGRAVETPRLCSYHGDRGLDYTYAGQTSRPAPWAAPLGFYKAFVSKLCGGAPFNTCLVNYYRDERDSIDWHADDERELGPRQPDDVLVASLSLGAARGFELRTRAPLPEPRALFDTSGEPRVTLGQHGPVLLSGIHAGREGSGRYLFGFALQPGDLFVMGGSTQRDWEHRLPKGKRPASPRLSLTFRIVRPQ
jgi:alkylated DNA repair dioxygenase AlkB